MRIFLDDVREPKDCLGYMHTRIGNQNFTYLQEWVIARNYEEFVNIVSENIDAITYVSFDHDLAEGHYHKNMQNGVINYDSADFQDDANKTGYHAAKWMMDFYNGKKYNMPIIFVHSMNPVGTENILKIFK